MSDFFDTPSHPVARKQHRCGPCYTAILVGEKHVCQSGFFEGSAFRNRYHQECWDELIKEGNFEFTPGDFEPPIRVAIAAGGSKV